MRSRTLTRSPSCARLPLIVRRPAAIQPSISRREPRPCAARTFWTRCASVALGVVLIGMSSGDCRLEPPGRFGVLAQVGHRRRAARRVNGRLASGKGLREAELERDAELVDIPQLRERRQLVEILEPEVVEELARRAIERRTSGHVAM